MQETSFDRPDGILVAGVGILMIAAASVGIVALIVMSGGLDLKTYALALIGWTGACALGWAFVNAWRTPMLTVRPDALIVPSWFASRTIPIRPGHPIGELLAIPDFGGHRPGNAEGNKFAHIYTLDDAGKLTLLTALHRDAPALTMIRRALTETAGLRLERLEKDLNARRTLPEISHWKRPPRA
ncbi:hypothetical protein ATO6_07070 [Oceanicola sp. 22II-s10i]|uniref:hypothetical protein n=1 Tax=Oceanicola sp. 22II-s10i TaxID=1317116 RepID=UPI000B5286BC|nr:hypothetical protein [Oceanicola sp. 22II-s10i]OWU86542.1 hypothetical protein ATO6_07070 [Oceanicola sp. 22II-s10i]